MVTRPIRRCDLTLLGEKFAIARRASGLTFKQITEASGSNSPTTYINHEKEPGEFRLKEVEGIYKSMNDAGKKLLRDAIMDIFLD